MHLVIFYCDWVPLGSGYLINSCTGLLVLDDGSRANAVSGREGTVVGGLILLSSEGVRGGDGERI